MLHSGNLSGRVLRLGHHTNGYAVTNVQRSYCSKVKQRKKKKNI